MEIKMLGNQGAPWCAPWCRTGKDSGWVQRGLGRGTVAEQGHWLDASAAPPSPEILPGSLLPAMGYLPPLQGDREQTLNQRFIEINCYFPLNERRVTCQEAANKRPCVRGCLVNNLYKRNSLHLQKVRGNELFI